MNFLARSLLFVWALAGCAVSPITSTEGLADPNSIKKGAVVFAPRAARAQKIIFDDGTKELIHAPDTPLRRFFESHSPDFRGGKLEYAKTTILGDLIDQLRGRNYLGDLVRAVVERHLDLFIPQQIAWRGCQNPGPGTGERGEEKAKARAELFAAALELELQRSGYPDIGDDSISKVLSDYKASDPWRLTVKANAAAQELFQADLRTTLVARGFLRDAIDEAVSNRKDLFATSGSPVAAMTKARGELVRFVREQLGKDLVGALAEGRASLWTSFLESQNDAEEGPFASGTRALNSVELAALGNELRKELREKLEGGGKAADAMRAALEKPTLQQYTRAESQTSRPSTADRATWGEELEKHPTLRTTYGELTDALVTEGAKKAALKTVDEQVEGMREEHATARAAAKEHLEKAQGFASGLKTKLADLQSERNGLLLHPDAIEAGDGQVNIARAQAWHTSGSVPPGEHVEAIHVVRALLGDSLDSTVGAKWDLFEEARGEVLAELGDRIEEAKTRTRRLQEVASDSFAFVTLQELHQDAVPRLEEDLAKNGFISLEQALRQFTGSVAGLSTGGPLAHDEAIKLAATFKAAASGKLTTFVQSDITPDVKAINELAKILQPELTGLQDWAKASNAEVEEVKALGKAEEDLAAATQAVEAKRGTVASPAPGTFAWGWKLAVEENAPDVPKSPRPALAKWFEHLFAASWKTLGEERGAAEKSKYTLLSTEAVATWLETFDTGPGREAAREDAAKRFAELFEGRPALLASDAPILSALVSADVATFASDAARARAASALSTAFTKEVSKQGENPGLDEVVAALEAAVAAPSVSYLFGAGATNDRVIEAFSKELFHAFRYRIEEALAAEREADYEYWWLTFYPKAVALGTRRFQGQSLIEVSFPKSVVPEEDYRRWLSEQGRGVYRREDLLSSTKGVNRYINWRRAAVDVLNDFLIVLGTSDLIDQHSEVRVEIHEALRQFNGADQSDQPPCAQDLYQKGMGSLKAAAQVGYEESPPWEYWVKVVDGRGSPFASSTELGCEESSLWEYWAKVVNGRGSPFASSTRDKAVQYLAFRPFDVGHVLQAAIDAGRAGAVLPNAVDLYLHSYFPRARQFSRGLSREDFGIAMSLVDPKYDGGEPEPNYVIPFKRGEELRDVSRFLRLKGVSAGSLRDFDRTFGALTEILKEILKDANENLPSSSALNALLPNLRNPPSISARQEAGRFAEKLSAKYGSYVTPSEMIREFSGSSVSEQGRLSAFFATGMTYRDGEKPDPYLRHPQLWLLEMQLAAAEADLRRITGNLFFSLYPRVPGRARLLNEFNREWRNFDSIVYKWLRGLWLECQEREFVYDPPYSPKTDPSAPTGFDGNSRIQLFVYEARFLTPAARDRLREYLRSSRDIYAWLDAITKDSMLVDQLSEKLFGVLYADLIDALGVLANTDRRFLSLDKVEKHDYEAFLDFAKPNVQPGIQVVDLLPSSRDDLVAMSISEGGAVAELAGKAGAAMRYEANALGVLTDALGNSERNFEGSSRGRSEEELFEQDGSGLRSSESLREIDEVLRAEGIERSGETFGQSLSTSARGSAYARARAAFAYSRRREYLDAAITAAGRGDSFAKWVVRESDVRSSITNGDARRNQAAAHNGQPNGDQPFQMLVKVPAGSVQIDWEGRRYILFNSSYTATGRRDHVRDYGHLARLPQLVTWLLNPQGWKDFESFLVSSSFPFRWSSANSEDKDEDQRERILRPNLLGGRVELDDTDKIRYSEILARIDAETAFIRTTRGLQLSEVQSSLDALGEQFETFDDEVNDLLIERLQAQRKLYEDQEAGTGLADTRAELRSRIEELETRIQELEEQASEPEDPQDLEEPEE